MAGMDRRRFLRHAGVAAAGALLPGCNSDLLDIFNEGEERLWGMHVHPFGGALAGAQIEVLRRLGIRRVRIVIGLHTNPAASYIGAFPAEYVGLLGDYGLPIPDPVSWPGLVRQAVERTPGLYAYEVLNEPTLSPGLYVQQYLKPAYQAIRAVSPSSKVVAAAPQGTSGGRLYFYQMTEAGADAWCDLRAVHLYADHPEVYLAGTDRPFIVTESGVEDPARHIDWWSETMAHISGVLETERLYFYALSTLPDSAWAVISSHSQPGAIQVISPLHDYVRGRYGPDRRGTHTVPAREVRGGIGSGPAADQREDARSVPGSSGVKVSPSSQDRYSAKRSAY